MKLDPPKELYRGHRTGEVIWPGWTEEGKWYLILEATVSRTGKLRVEWCRESRAVPPPPAGRQDRSPYRPTGRERPVTLYEDHEPRHNLCSYFDTRWEDRAGRLGRFFGPDSGMDSP